jgi:uncharacterized RDD family membrane protein YckC
MEIMPDRNFAHAPRADTGARIGAYLIDVLIIVGISLVPFVGWVAGPAYLLTRDALPFLDGQSVGKKALQLRAVDENGAPLTGNWGPCVVRNVVLLIPFFPLVELIVLLTNANGLRLGDQWGKTRVVRIN